MPLELTILTERKGSNPGGKILFPYQSRMAEAYLKHAYGSHLNKTNPLTACNQPIYEALIYEMATNIGVMVPEYVVLQNNDDLVFDERLCKLDFSDTFPFYFISIISPSYSSDSLTQIDPKTVENQIKKEKLDREILFISDIEHKAQNYYWDPLYHRIIYNDLGCNFVHAVSGFIQKPTGISNGEYDFLSKKERKTLSSKLSQYYLDTLLDTTISLCEFVEEIPNIKINLENSKGKKSIEKLISEQEIDFIRDIYLRRLSKIIGKFINKGIVKID